MTDRKDLLRKAGGLFEGQPRLVRLPSKGKVALVGDTHGDLETTEDIVRRYLKKPYRIVFLGDYVDRGSYSEENILYLLDAKARHPEEIHLLAGNHEGYRAKPFVPSCFWESLSDEEIESYTQLFVTFPLAAASDNGILALHGGLPDLSSLDATNEIIWGDENWNRILWGDFLEESGEILGEWGGRPQFGRDYFDRMMVRYQKQVLIRSHQPNSPRVMYDGRCITVFSSRAYAATRTIVLVDLERQIRTAKDVTIETL